MLLTSQLAIKKKDAGFCYVVICTKPVNRFKVGDVMKFSRNQKQADNHAAVRAGNAKVFKLNGAL